MQSTTIKKRDQVRKWEEHMPFECSEKAVTIVVHGQDILERSNIPCVQVHSEGQEKADRERIRVGRCFTCPPFLDSLINAMDLDAKM